MTYHDFSPDIFSIGPLSVRWYGFMYLLGFLSAWALGRWRAKKNGVFTPAQFDDVLTWGIAGVLLGARLGYVLFYNPLYYLEHPLETFYVWQGGMSFHGGFLGVIIASGLAGRRFGRGLFETMDFLAPLVPPGLFFGRIGNFINAELWGRVTDMPWGVVFPGAGSLPRHPSQLYEAALEGALLFVILWRFSAKPRPTMAVSGVFACGYGIFRFCIEFFRVPDAHIGYLASGWLTMGMVLCVPVFLTGALLLVLAYRRQ